MNLRKEVLSDLLVRRWIFSAVLGWHSPKVVNRIRRASTHTFYEFIVRWMVEHSSQPQCLPNLVVDHGLPTAQIASRQKCPEKSNNISSDILVYTVHTAKISFEMSAVCPYIFGDILKSPEKCHKMFEEKMCRLVSSKMQLKKFGFWCLVP